MHVDASWGGKIGRRTRRVFTESRPGRSLEEKVGRGGQPQDKLRVRSPLYPLGGTQSSTWHHRPPSVSTGCCSWGSHIFVAVNFCFFFMNSPFSLFQIGEMRRDLFRLMGVGEFSNDALWNPPHELPPTISSNDGSGGGGRSLLVHLPEVTCPTCNYIRDLDVCRDRHLTLIGGIWCPVCPHCGTAYSKGYLEAGLLSQLEQITMQFILQVGLALWLFRFTWRRLRRLSARLKDESRGVSNGRSTSGSYVLEGLGKIDQRTQFDGVILGSVPENAHHL